MLPFPSHTSHKLQPLDGCISGPFKKFYNVASCRWMLSKPVKHTSAHSIAHLTSLAYSSAFSPSNIQSGFCIIGFWPINSDIFTVDKSVSPYVMDRPKTAVPESANEADHPPSAYVDVLLHMYCRMYYPVLLLLLLLLLMDLMFSFLLKFTLV
jgi:hypothetical protein